MDMLTSSKVPAVGQTGALLRHARLGPAALSTAGHPSASQLVLCWFAGLHVHLGRDNNIVDDLCNELPVFERL